MANSIRFLVAALTSVAALILTLPALLIAFPFWLVAALQRVWIHLSNAAGQAALPWGALIEYTPVIGWRPKPNLHAAALDMAGNRYVITTDGEGWRASPNASAQADVYVFGDSFAFGFGANDRQFFANLNAEPRIRAIGANGYNTVQQLLLMEQYGERLAGRVVIWFIYHGNDLYENLTPNMRRYRMPFVRQRGDGNTWEIVTHHVRPEPWSLRSERDYYAKLAEICCDTPLSKSAFAACEFLLQRGKRLCDEVGAKLIVVSLPDVVQLDQRRSNLLASKAPDPESFDVDRPDKELARICLGAQLPFNTIKGVLTAGDYIHNDVHWNARGNRRVADMLRSIYSRTR
jgi:hypothetical protein